MGCLTIGLLGLAGCDRGDGLSGVATPEETSTGSSTELSIGGDGLVLDVDVGRSAADVPRAPISDDHTSTVSWFGTPDRFVLRFEGGTRHEVWHYDSAEVDVVFRDGVRLYVEPVEPPAVAGLGTTRYSPDQFSGGMTLEDLLAVTGARGFAEQPLDVVDGRLVVVRGLVAAFDGDALRYLQTVPIELE